jgi:voltage-dependent anion channel protein 2
MAPPSYSDIGKSARDVFGKGYHFGLVKLEVKSKSASGLEFTAGGNTTTDGGKVSGSLETKMACKDHGLKLTEKWNTDNSVNATVDYEKLMPGLKLTLDGSFQPNTGDKAGKLKTEYKHDRILFNADMGLASSPVVNMSAAVGHGPYALGYQTAFDTGKSALTKHNLALNYAAGDMTLHTTSSDFKVFGGGIYLKNSAQLETGITASSTIGGGSNFAIGCKYALDKDAAVRAKVDTNSQIGLSYQQKLRDGITMTLSSNIDGTKLNQPGHKLGLCLEMEA